MEEGQLAARHEGPSVGTICRKTYTDCRWQPFRLKPEGNCPDQAEHDPQEIDQENAHATVELRRPLPRRHCHGGKECGTQRCKPAKHHSIGIAYVEVGKAGTTIAIDR